MKANLTGSRARKLCLTFACAFLAIAAPAAEDINTVFQQGRTAYYSGNIELARTLLNQVLLANPKHFETRALLAQINTHYKKGDDSLQKQYSAVTIPKFQVSEVTLAESLEALGILTKNASNGKVTPNFIIKNADLNKTPITLNLTNVPLTEAIRYLAEMTKAKATWDKHAVMFSGIAD